MDEKLDTLLDREHLTLASVRARIGAFVIDELLLSTLLFIILWDVIANANTVESMILVTNNFLVEFIMIKIAYQTFFSIQYGATIGKIVMKIRIVEVRTVSNPGILSAFNRAVLRILSETLFYLGFAWAFFDPYRRGWHDFTAKTLVVNA